MKRFLSAVAVLALLAGGAPAWATAIDSNTKLLLQANTPTAGGNVKAIYFDGSGDYLSLADSSDWQLGGGTGAFTVEATVRMPSLPSYGTIYCQSTDANNWVLLRYSATAGQWQFNLYSGASLIVSMAASDTPATNKAVHIAVVRNGNDWTMYKNGISIATQTASVTYPNFTGTLKIGAFDQGLGDYFIGSIKNFRISDVARYTAAFVPSTDNFTSDSNTKLLLTAEESLHATTFTDSEGTPKTVTTNGDAVNKLTSDFRESIITDTEGTPKYPITQYGDVKIDSRKGSSNNTGLFVNGSTDWIIIPNSSDFDFGTGDLTIEFWWNKQGPQGLAFNPLYCRDNGSNDGLMLGYIDDTTFNLYINQSDVKQWSYVMPKKEWVKIALVRSSGTWQLYINGKGQSSYSNASDVNYSGDLWIGHNVGGSSYVNGFLKNYRVSNSARYTADYTPSDSAFTSDSNTKLLIHGTTNATSPLSTWVKVDGTGDYMTIPDAAWQDFGTGDWTVEGVVRWNSVANSTLLTVGTSTNGIRMAVNDTGGTAGFHTYVVNTKYQGSPGYTPLANRNYHFAAVRDGNTLRMFIDGKSYGTADITGKNVTGLTQGVTFGGDQGGGSLVNGWIRNIRISNVARYTAAFTPPTTEFSTDANTMFLLTAPTTNGATSFTDGSSNAATITVNGDTKSAWQEDWRSTVITDSGNTGHKIAPEVTGRAKIDFVSVFGYGALDMDGTLDHLTLADNADWQFNSGTGKFTVDAWVRPTAFGNTQEIVSQGTDGSTYMDFRLASATELRFQADNTVFSYASPLTGNPAMVANTWYHVAVIRGWGGVTNDYAITVNGSSITTGTDASNYPDYSGLLGVGNLSYGSSDQGAQYYWQGKMDNLRISDVARWTATFDPETADFGGSRRKSAVLF